MVKRTAFAAVLALAAVLAGCGGGTSSSTGNSGISHLRIGQTATVHGGGKGETLRVTLESLQPTSGGTQGTEELEATDGGTLVCATVLLKNTGTVAYNDQGDLDIEAIMTAHPTGNQPDAELVALLPNSGCVNPSKIRVEAGARKTVLLAFWTPSPPRELEFSPFYGEKDWGNNTTFASWDLHGEGVSSLP